MSFLRCCAGICGGGADSATAPVVPIPRRPVAFPVIPVDEAEIPTWSSEEFAARLELETAPYEAEESPLAFVTKDFKKNGEHLMVLLPSADATLGTWDHTLGGGRGSAVPAVRWAVANGLSVCLFHPRAFGAGFPQAWERVLIGSPAKHVTVLVARGMRPALEAALAPVHTLLLTRFRNVLVQWGDRSDSAADVPDALCAQLASALVQMPAAWTDMGSHAMYQCLYEMLQARADRYSKREATKCDGLRNLKENDIPGLKRLGLAERVNRMDRDRGNDELSRHCQRHGVAGAADEEEPGVD